MHYFTIEQRESLQAGLRSLVERLRGEGDAQLLRTAEAALERLHDPGFGLCEDCGADIPYARLSSDPVATRCVACQAQRERGAAPAART